MCDVCALCALCPVLIQNRTPLPILRKCLTVSHWASIEKNQTKLLEYIRINLICVQSACYIIHSGLPT